MTTPETREKASRLAKGLASLAVAAAVYEWVAVVHDTWPTISDGIWWLPLPARVAVVAAALLAMFDHFLTRRYL